MTRALLPLPMRRWSLRRNPNLDKIQQTIQAALLILGNALAHISQERRTKVLAHLNPDLAKDTDFSKDAPLLFGAGFQKQAKEHLEAVSCLRKAASYAPKKEDSSYRKLFFRGARSVERRPGKRELQL